MPYPHFDALLAAVSSLPPLPIAVVDATEEHVLRGACAAHASGIIEPILIGSESKIRSLLSTLCSEYSGCASIEIVAAETEADAAEKGVAIVASGRAKALMKGHLHTDTFLHPILARCRTERRLSHVFVADIASYPKLLLITDAAINISPDLPTKAAILQNAIDLANILEVEHPKAAVLSAVEVINPAIPSTIDAACLAKMADRGQILGAEVDGPLAFDNAISAEAARIKGIRSTVAGDADILLVPDLVSGNILAKDLEYLAGASLAGIVLGARVPIILNSRADPVRARLVSTALAVLMQREAASCA
ncbi:bifunctional enoyl-CoA hydratase/phosphate acetyltransferase [Candidatus Igneacidithiobacillus taiwanensis]|uniref:bifunctional enoyl-CoA hydratase/phosphate acetyltransferase n=1 Tax=Candidatus Igneacidithiobacillus taiwanensis TaxID=1945924 RepID=UPI00289DC3FE|nr:bifunctional enoyl-CoA hydratase/phosphate acetyltransferase [Candidatus Igneacidithiobacillus taiwanensis]